MSSKTRVAVVPQHAHSEAYCVMKYASKDGSREEYLWNSRDGVTPFGIQSRGGDQTLYHVNWENDIYDPLHVPRVGERIFVDATEELVRPAVVKYVDENWESEKCPLSAFKDTKEEAIAFFLDDWVYHRNPDGKEVVRRPWVVEVTQEIRKQFGDVAELRAEIDRLKGELGEFDLRGEGFRGEGIQADG